MGVPSRVCVIATAVAWLAAVPAGAQEPEVVALRAQVAQIRAQLEAVEARLRAVEAGTPVATPAAVATAASAAPLAPAAVAAAPVTSAAVTPVAPAARVVAPPATPVAGAVGAPPDPAAARRIAWRQLHEGQSEAEVEALLGAPTKRFELSGKLVRYYYYQGVGAGSVFFDSSGHISSVQHPPGSG